MLTPTLLTLLADIAPTHIAPICRPGPHCILSTAIGQMVLARLGIEAEPYPVELTLCNKAWWEWGEVQFEGGPAEQLRRGAYILTNTPFWNGQSFVTQQLTKAWDGHLILKIPPYLLDLDLGSMARPQHGIHVPPGIMGPINAEGGMSGRFTSTDLPGVETHVMYRPLESPVAHDYVTSKDWVGRDRYTELVEAIAFAVETELAKLS